MARLPLSIAEEVCRALEALYHNPDRNIKHEANKWLVSFQRVKWEPWGVCDKILSMPQISSECHFFAANTLRLKLLQNFDELPKSDWLPFRDSLLAHAERHSMQTVRTMLSLCVACLTVQMAQEWETAIVDLTNRFGREETALVLLDILTVLPEEINDENLLVDLGVRTMARNTAVHHSTNIMSILFSYLQSTSSLPSEHQLPLQQKVMKAFLSWIKAGVLRSSELPDNPLFRATFDALALPGLAGLATDVMVEMVKVSKDIADHDVLAKAMITRSLQLRQIFEKTQRTGDHELALRLSRVFAQLGESYLPFIVEGTVQGSQEADSLLNSLLLVASHSQKNVATNSFHFWYILSVRITTKTEQHSPLEPQQMELFFSYFSRLILSLKAVMEYPVEFLQLGSEEKEECKKFRYIAAETLLDAATVLEGYKCLQLVYEGLQIAGQSWTQHQENWQPLEACLYCVRSLARKVPPTENMVIPQVMKIVPAVNNHPQLRYTATLIIGRYADWIAHHPDFLKPLLEFVVVGMNIPEVVSSSSLAFKHVCEGCALHLATHHLENLFGVYMQAFRLTFQDQIEIIEGICYVTLVLPPDQVHGGIHRMLAPIAAAIQQGIATKDAPALSLSLSRLAEVFRFLSPKLKEGDPDPNIAMEAVQKVVVDLWSLLEQTMTVLKGDEKKMEKVCRCWKYAIKASKQHFRPLLDNLLCLLRNHFDAFPHSSFLYTAAICVDQFAAEPDTYDLMEGVFREFSQRSFKILCNLDGFTNHPDVAEDFFEFVSRFLRRCPAIIFKDPLLPVVFECGLGGLGIHHREACMALMQFFGLLIHEGIDNPRVNSKRPGKKGPPKEYVEKLNALLAQYGPRLVEGLMQNIAGAVPKHHIRDVIPVLESLVALNRRNAYEWVKESLTRLPETKHPNKREFLMGFSQAQDIRAVRECLMAWAKACRHSKRANSASEPSANEQN